MTVFTAAFVFFILFSVGLGAAALFFLSFDAQESDTPEPATRGTQRLFQVVRRVNTDTIETVDASGTIRQWHAE